jgi:SAM-dependent methyltransferase
MSTVNHVQGRADAGRPGLREETACALCGRREYRTIARVDRDGRPLMTVMCDACGLVWTNPRPSDADVDRYYEREYRADYARHRSPTPRKVLRGLLGAEERRPMILALAGPAGRVLDVGCGAGELVYLLRLHGVDAAGIEPGEEYADFSRRVLAIPIQTATVDTAVVEPASFDVVTMFHMLEHVANPGRVLEEVRGWLRQGGALVVEVPNVESTAQAPRHRFHFAHLHSFSPATLAAFGESAGFDVQESRTTSDGGNIVCVFRMAERGTRPVVALPGSAARTREVLERHTAVRHFLTPTPYRRVADRLARRWRENRLLARLPTVQAVIEWAASGMPGPR